MLLALLCLSSFSLPAQSEDLALPAVQEPERSADNHLYYFGQLDKSPGFGRRVVLIAGDEEYRSEEVQPMLARQLARLGFECIVLFSQDPETGEVDPNQQQHIPGTEWIADADLLVLQLRFRALPDEQMKPLVDYIEAGKPVIGLRTSTHAFDYRKQPDAKYATWSFHSNVWPGGFGKQVLGENWVAHHGGHGSQATRALPHPAQVHHPVMRGVGPIFGPSDVYTVNELPADAIRLMDGQVVAGMSPDDPALAGAKNDPMIPVAWLRATLRALMNSHGDGEPVVQRVFTTTMGTAADWSDVDLRRLFLNASLWCLGDEDAIPLEGFPATLDEDWQPTAFGFGKARLGYKPQDYLQASPWAQTPGQLQTRASEKGETSGK
jgi:hypothetical protein